MTRRDALGNGHGDRPRDRRYVDLRTEHGLIEGDRQFDLDIIAVPLEHRVRADSDRDECVTGRPVPETRPALSAQAQGLPVLQAAGDGDLDRFAIGHRHAALGSPRRVEEIDLEMVSGVLTTGMDVLPVLTAASWPPASEQIRKQV